jgi:sulfite exporter TauE/SafE
METLVGQFGEGFVLGLATGHICLATCGPVYLPFLAGKLQTFRGSLLALLKLSAGRFVTYLLIGALAGFLGYQISDVNRQYFTIIAYILLSVFLIVSALRGHRCESGCKVGRLSRFADSPFILGIVTGINFCPSFLIAFTRSFDLAGPIAGMSFFTAFFFGTTIFLIPLVFAGFIGRKKQFRTFARIAALGVAVWFLAIASVSIYNIIHENRNIISLLDSTPQQHTNAH